MFGKSILVSPVTEPNITEWNVYLPKSTSWYDFWTGKYIRGGLTIKTDASFDKIPLFIKAGSIIPMGKLLQYTGEKTADTLEIRIYKGANGRFDLYEDEGDNYNYEKGNYTTIPFIWDEQHQTLTIGKKEGGYPGCLNIRTFNIVFVNETNGSGINFSAMKNEVQYSGDRIEIKSK
jgi:alpha-D-xyloside xylohydrolase